MGAALSRRFGRSLADMHPTHIVRGFWRARLAFMCETPRTQTVAFSMTMSVLVLKIMKRV